MNGIQTGVALYIRAVNIGDSREARSALAEIARAALEAEEDGNISTEAVVTVLLDRHTDWLLGRL